MTYKVNGNIVIEDATSSGANGIFNFVYFQRILNPIQGYNYGYANRGNVKPSPAEPDTIEKFSFADSIASTTAIQNLTGGLSLPASQSSTEHGYISGGASGGKIATITRFQFSNDKTSFFVGNLTAARYSMGGQSSTEHGYTGGGTIIPTVPVTSAVIDRFPFAVATTNATNVGNLSIARFDSTGQSSETHGYNTGGFVNIPASPSINVIDRYPFAVALTNATNVGTLTLGRAGSSGQSSYTHGYNSGGTTPPSSVDVNVIDRFPFAVITTNATDVGDLTDIKVYTTGISSYSHGYVLGGSSTFVINSDIERYPFASSVTNSELINYMTDFRRGSAGNQY